jgi:hypothetical protein
MAGAGGLASARRRMQAVEVPSRQRRGGGGRGQAACETRERREEGGPGTWAVMGWLA